MKLSAIFIQNSSSQDLLYLFVCHHTYRRLLHWSQCQICHAVQLTIHHLPCHLNIIADRALPEQFHNNGGLDGIPGCLYPLRDDS